MEKLLFCHRFNNGLCKRKQKDEIDNVTMQYKTEKKKMP